MVAVKINQYPKIQNVFAHVVRWLSYEHFVGSTYEAITDEKQCTSWLCPLFTLASVLVKSKGFIDCSLPQCS
eukprot:scaffold605077_cov17-Prasinocladus_malaysianus.AAC.1